MRAHHDARVAYDVDLADRIRELVATEPALDEKRMFGGLAFLLDGRLAVAAGGKGALMVRVDPARTDEFVARPGAERMVMRGKALDGWLHVDPEVLDDASLRRWVAEGVAYVRSLPGR